MVFVLPESIFYRIWLMPEYFLMSDVELIVKIIYPARTTFSVVSMSHASSAEELVVSHSSVLLIIVSWRHWSLSSLLLQQIPTCRYRQHYFQFSPDNNLSPPPSLACLIHQKEKWKAISHGCQEGTYFLFLILKLELVKCKSFSKSF